MCRLQNAFKLKTMIIQFEVDMKDGLELFKLLDITVKTKDCITYEKRYHNQEVEVPDKRLMAKCPTTGTWVDFVTAYKAVAKARSKELLMDTDRKLAYSVISNLNQ